MTDDNSAPREWEVRVRKIVSITTAAPGTRVVYFSKGGDPFLDPLTVWAMCRCRVDFMQDHTIPGRRPIRRGFTEWRVEVIGMVEGEIHELVNDDDPSFVGYLMPGEVITEAWWARHGRDRYGTNNWEKKIPEAAE